MLSIRAMFRAIQLQISCRNRIRRGARQHDKGALARETKFHADTPSSVKLSIRFPGPTLDRVGETNALLVGQDVAHRRGELDETRGMLPRALRGP